MENSLYRPFSNELQSKIDLLSSRKTPIKMGEISFSGRLFLAPMASICNAPFRLLMEQLGAGGTVSELISCHGINHGNQKTMDMLRIDKAEKNVGIQLFGEDTESMAIAAQKACEFSPKFIDINMGCPVRKVVTKGGGSALMQDPSKLGKFFAGVKKAINVPLTIKIRTGWDEQSINALEIINIANSEGVEMVAVHGRTRSQQYRGHANWELLESLATESPLPLIGNGDLHSAKIVKERLQKTNCEALMLARGPLRNPFIFLESFIKDDEDIIFDSKDYLEVIKTYYDYLSNFTEREKTLSVQMKKHIVWFAAGFPNTAKFRSRIYQTKELNDVMNLTEDYFLSVGSRNKQLNLDEPFMTGGHG